jgi:hypothetical protein
VTPAGVPVKATDVAEGDSSLNYRLAADDHVGDVAAGEPVDDVRGGQIPPQRAWLLSV